ncbi:plant/protein [Thalictrum thalictroides]|uniref:Plant/protein n=1 Tax=Thalictrum thalictroides TaxID=46969 RepID=A0A7J6UZC0_THATH|nr:plant/protein [Thalictrum thalictroides]
MEGKDEKKVSDKHNSDALKHIQKKMVTKGLQRMERHPSDGLSLTHLPKSGHGGKYTWEGPVDAAENELEAVPAIDEKDPNYVDEDVKEDAEFVVGEVEVAKVVEDKEGVARVEVHPSLQV